jgi:uncharacterized membrane protein
MQIGTSILLIAIGAILKFAVTATVSGISLATVGVILLVVGIIGLVLSLMMMTMWADRGARRAVVAEPVVRERYVDPADPRY